VAVINMPFQSPVLLAKQLATIDILSGGRLDAGLGIGWSDEEFAAVGMPKAGRAARAEQFVAALKACWADGVVDFTSDLYEIPRSIVEPKPVQRPHPPLLLGGSADPALRRAGRIADGWVSSSAEDLTRIDARIDLIKASAAEAGRDPEALRFIVRGVVKVRPAGAQDRRPLTGSFDEIRSDLDGLPAKGVTEVFLDLNFDPEVGVVDADPAESEARAEQVLTELAPR
jgi:probable F420-dependent oxidoreductase